MAVKTGGTRGVRAVVAATDFSKASLAGVEWARLLARHHHAHLHLVHAAPPIRSSRVAIPPQMTEPFLREAERRLVALAPGRSPRVTAHVAAGRPYEMILEVARQVKVDVIVLATRGQALGRLVTGSTAARVVHLAPCPVLSVPPRAVAPASLPKRVLAATDFSRDAALAARAAIRLFALERRGARLDLLHVWALPTDLAVYGGSGLLLDLPAEALRAAAERDLATEAARLRRVGAPVEAVLREGPAAAAIFNEGASRDVGAVAVGTGGLGGWAGALMGSDTERVLRRATWPVLTARAAGETP